MRSAVMLLAIPAFRFLAAPVEQVTIIGTIYRLAPNQISVKTPRGSFMIPADDKTEVVKGKAYRDLALLKLGDEVSIHCETASGKPVAARIFANLVTFSATVTNVTGDDIEVITIANADYAREEHRIVRIHADTAFGATRKNLSAGQNIRIVGLLTDNGAVDASRVALYNTDVPTYSPLLKRK